MPSHDISWHVNAFCSIAPRKTIARQRLQGRILLQHLFGQVCFTGDAGISLTDLLGQTSVGRGKCAKLFHVSFSGKWSCTSTWEIFSKSYACSEPVDVDEPARMQSPASSSFWPTLLVVWMLVKMCFDDGAIKSESKAGGRQGGEKGESGRWLSHSPW